MPIEENETLSELMREVDVMRALQSPYILRQYCTYVRDNLLWVLNRQPNTRSFPQHAFLDLTRVLVRPPAFFPTHPRSYSSGATQIVLEYCPGGSVSDYMRVCKRTFGETHIASIARCVSARCLRTLTPLPH